MKEINGSKCFMQDDVPPVGTWPELAKMWWKIFCETGEATNPASTGRYDIDDQNEVLYLPGSIGGSKKNEFHVAISKGSNSKYAMGCILGEVVIDKEEEEEGSRIRPEDLPVKALESKNDIEEAYALLNGEKMDPFPIETSVFDVRLPEDNIWKIRNYGDAKAAAYGHYVFIEFGENTLRLETFGKLKNKSVFKWNDLRNDHERQEHLNEVGSIVILKRQ